MSVLKTYGLDTAGFKPSKTFRLANGRLEGMIDGEQAMRQAIYLILSIERFRYLIYSSDYGIELAELIGKKRSYVMGDIERRFLEALSEDDRVTGMKDFNLSFEGENAIVSFLVKTKFGEIPVERRIAIG